MCYGCWWPMGNQRVRFSLESHEHANLPGHARRPPQPSNAGQHILGTEWIARAYRIVSIMKGPGYLHLLITWTWKEWSPAATIQFRLSDNNHSNNFPIWIAPRGYDPQGLPFLSLLVACWSFHRVGACVEKGSSSAGDRPLGGSKVDWDYMYCSLTSMSQLWWTV